MAYIEKLDFGKRLKISKRAAGIAPSKAYLSEKESYKVEDLILCILMASANDAGVVLAEAMACRKPVIATKIGRNIERMNANLGDHKMAESHSGRRFTQFSMGL